MDSENEEPAEVAAAATEVENEFEVEKILKKRLRNGKVEYFIKWKNFSDEDSTWEPEDNLECEDLVAAFNDTGKELQDGPGTERKASSSGGGGPPAKKGFDRGFEADEITGATDAAGELMFLMKWKGCSESDLVLAKVANKNCPQVVIKFYEDRLAWQSNDD